MKYQLIAIAALAVGLSACLGGFRYRDAEPLPFDEIDYGHPVQTALEVPEVAYVDVGSGPETLVLIHGLASNLGFWRYNIADLAEEYRVIAIDLPGYGHSEKSAIFPYTLSYFAETIQRLAEHLELDEVTLVGQSMGGQIAMVAALTYPELVDRLVLVDPAGIETFNPGEAAWLRNVYTVAGIRLTPEDAIRRNLTLNFYEWDDEWEWMVEERARLAKTDEFDEFAFAVKKSVGAMLDESTAPYLEQIEQPTLIVYGEYDGLIPNPYLHPGFARDVFEEGHQRIPNSTLVAIPDAGHLSMIERPEAFDDIVKEWLRAH
ncbi:MAG: alpha/beta fold hydrolase [Candidatus Longimicrobiales bacterium M2_2A_002]